MSNVIKFSITGDTNAEQVTNRAKAAVSGFDKQVEGIQKKFGSAFKDIFLGFAAPMVILNNAISMIAASIEKAKQDAQDGIDLMAKGETLYANAEEKKTAAFFKAKAAREKEMEQVAAGREQLGRDFSQTEAGRKAMQEFLGIGLNRFMVSGGPGGQPNYEGVFKNRGFQDFMIKKFVETPEGAAYKPIFEDKSGTSGTFKGPEGFGNVIGVGPNPVIEAMALQTEVLQDIKIILQESKPASGGVPAPFTQQTPSRTSFLR